MTRRWFALLVAGAVALMQPSIGSAAGGGGHGGGGGGGGGHGGGGFGGGGYGGRGGYGGYGGYGRGGYGYGGYGGFGFYDFGYPGYGYGLGYGGYAPDYYAPFYGMPPYGPVAPYNAPAPGVSMYYSPQNTMAQPSLGNAAAFAVRVPASAEVWFDGDQTKQTGPERSFVSPTVEPGKKFSYNVRARWTNSEGKVVDLTRKVEFQAGQRLNVDFLNP